MEAEQPQVAKKRVVKKKTQATVESTTVEPTTVEPTNVEQVSTENSPVEEASTDEPSCYIPSSRIKNYISREKLNKELDSLITKIKHTQVPLDLDSLLSKEQQSKLGGIIKQKEENKEEININTLAVELLSKQKFKFSNTSFKVLSAFLDIMVEEITLNVMDEIVKNKKSIINLKYVYSGRTDTPLYNIYSSLPTFVNELNALTKSSSEDVVDEETEVTEDEPTSSGDNEDSNTNEESSEKESSTHSINFEFYVRKICNKLKKNKEEYAKIKVSNNYQKFCSNLILEFLDRVAPMTTIVLEVMTTKTITNLVFESVIKLQLYDNVHCNDIMNEVKNRLS